MNGGTWLALARDVSQSVRVQGEPKVKAGMVLDMATGLVRGVAVGSSEMEALVHAFSMGLSRPAGGVPPGRPDEVLCPSALKVHVEEVLFSLGVVGPVPPVREIVPPAEAEDVFDSFIGHMAGRAQPAEPPSPSDWSLLYHHALAVYEAAPWERWHDRDLLALEMTIDRACRRYTAVVLGNAGIQRGLAVYAGDRPPAGLEDWVPGRPPPNPSGALVLTLDPPADLPRDLRAKALRYGWPPEAELLPVALRFGPEGEGGDPSDSEVQTLVVAMAAVTVHDARGPLRVRPGADASTGTVSLAGGRTATFSITQEPPAVQPKAPDFRFHMAGFDLVPQGTSLVLGHLSWGAVAALRAASQMYRPFSPGVPAPSGAEVPLVAILPGPEQGATTAAKVAELDPYGVTSVTSDDNREILVLAGGNGAQVLMNLPANSPSLADYRRRLRATKGLHVIMVADEAANRGEGPVYGFFECHQPPPRTKRRYGGKGSKASGPTVGDAGTP